MATVTVDKSGKLDLPEGILKDSHIKPGTKLVVTASNGKITIMDPQQVLRQKMKRVDLDARARLRKAISPRRDQPFFSGLSRDAYLALSDEEDKALWDRLAEQAEQEVKVVEQDIPPHFRPAGQKHSARGTSRCRPR